MAALAAGSPTSEEKKVSKLEIIIGSRNERGIPSASFCEDIGDFLRTSSLELDDLLQRQHELLSKYKFMDQHMQKNKVRSRVVFACVAARGRGGACVRL